MRRLVAHGRILCQVFPKPQTVSHKEDMFFQTAGFLSANSPSVL